MTAAGRACVVAVDIGSTYLKAALVRADGMTLAASRVAVPCEGGASAGELDAERLWQAFREAVRLLDLGPAASASGIAVTTQMAGLAVLDDRMRPLRPLIPGVDPRGSAYAAELGRRLGEAEIYARTGCPLLGIYPAAKLLALRAQEPSLFQGPLRIGGIKEVLLQRLTGAWTTDPASASVTQLYDQRRDGWWPEMLAALGLDAAALPRIAEPDALAGALLPSAAAALGLPAGLPISVGTGDGPAASWSTGAIAERDLCVSLGTTAVLRFVSGAETLRGERRFFRQRFSSRLCLQGYRLEGAGRQIDAALRDCAAEARREAEAGRGEFTAQAERVEYADRAGGMEGSEGTTQTKHAGQAGDVNGAGGLKHPNYTAQSKHAAQAKAVNGAEGTERSDAATHAELTALAAYEERTGVPLYFDPADGPEGRFYGAAQAAGAAARLDAVLEGILFTLYGALRPVLAERSFGSIRPIGGGAGNRRWMKSMADLFQSPVLLTGGDNTTGAAMILFKALGVFSSWREAADAMVRVTGEIAPNGAAAAGMQARLSAYEAAIGRRDRG